MSDEKVDPSRLQDFNSFARDLEQEVPELAEQRILREETDQYLARLRQRLKAARGRTSQEEVARRMGIRSQSRISRLEGADSELTVEALYRYARAIGQVPVISLVPIAQASSVSFHGNRAPRAHPELTEGKRIPVRRIEAMHERSLEKISDDLLRIYGDVGATLGVGPDAEDPSG